MKYFSYELIATCNEWTDPTARELRLARKRLHAAYEKYFKELESLKPRLSAAAWNFFRYGRDDTGLHDGRLLSFRIGDGLDYTPDGSSPFKLNYQRTSALVEFLNYEQAFHYTFDLRRVRQVQTDLFIDEELFAKSLGDLYLLELTETADKDLQLAFLFATGATMVIKFKRLVFRRRRLKRQYKPGEMYS
jgi:hypothetical protein